MAYNVSSAFREQLYSGESEFRAILTIGENTIDNDQIASISISSPIIDDSKQVFYVGTFISQKITIKFKTMEGINVNSGDRVELSIGQYVNNQWVDVPIGKFLVDDLAEDYYEKCEINCLDYAVLFKPNIDYSECFVDGKATIKMILEQVCTAVGVELGDYPTTNDKVEVGTYDSTVSGKQWISYIAELKGCNAKIDRLGRLTLQPLKQSSNVPINALESASWETKESFNVTQVTFFDAIRNYTFGSDDGDTLFIRQDNPFITEEKVVQNIYDTICVDKYSASGKSFDLEDVDAHPMQVKKIYGETSQDTYTGKNLMDLTTNSTVNGVTVIADYEVATINGTSTGNGKIDIGTSNLPAGTYTIMAEYLSGTIENPVYITAWAYYKGTWDRPTTASIGINGGGTKQSSATFTLTETKNVCYGLYLTEGRKFTNVKIRVSIVKGSTADFNFEKYVGGIPSPNPDYPQEIHNVSGDNQVVVCGKNIFDGLIESGAYNTSTGAKIVDANAVRNVNPIIVKPNTTYIISNNSVGVAMHVLQYNNNNQLVQYNLITSNNSFTTTSDTVYINIHRGNTNYDKLQIEKGTIITTYEAYNGTTYNIDLPVENVLGIPNQTFTHNGVQVTINNGEITLNGTATSTGTYNLNPTDTTNIIGKYIISLNKVSGTITNDTENRSNFNIRNANTQSFIYNITYNQDSIIHEFSNITSIMFGIYVYTGVTYNNFKYKPQLELGNKSNTFTPYGTTPIELNKIGDYQDYITRNTGKNLFEPMLVYNGTTIAKTNCTVVLNDDEYILTATGTDMYFSQVTNADEIYQNNRGKLYDVGNANKIYLYLTNSTFNKNFITFYDENLISLGVNSIQSSNGSVTVRENAKYFTVRFGYGSATSGTVYKTKVMVSYEPITDFEPYGKDEWYLKKTIGRYTFTGASNENWYLSGAYCIKCNALNTTLGYPLMNNIYNYINRVTLGLYSNYGISGLAQDIVVNDTTALIGLGSVDTGGGATDAIYVSRNGQSIADFKAKLANNPLICTYVLQYPEFKKITYQPLIDQLNALQNAGLFEGINHITVDTFNEVPTIDIDYYKNSHFNLWSLKTHNFGDFTLDAWDNIDYDLDGEHYLTLNNNTITYEMSIMSDVDTKIPNKQQTATTNIIGGDDKTNIKIIKTNVDNLNASVNILSKQQTDTQTNVTQLQLDVNGINQTVEHIENTEIGGLQSEISSVQQTMNTITNMFQISGGINSIRNSAFLLKDEVWEFTDNGTNPYHTDLGNSYNSTLSGTTVSVAEIKLRSAKVKSTSDNITNLKTDGTKYTFNFYHKQDNYMTTTIKMYSTENNTIKAFNDIVITGQQQFKNYEVSFVPTYTNYTIEIIVTSTASVGYAYISDMILNAGDKQSWQPASDEIYSTTLQMSRLGLQVYSVGDGTITLLGSDGMSTWETSDGKTFGRLVSIRTINGDRVKNVTTQSIKLVLDATKTEEELATENKWVETVINIGGSRYKVEYEESGE